MQVVLEALQRFEERRGEDGVEGRALRIEQDEARGAVGCQDVRIGRGGERIGVARADRLAGDDDEAEGIVPDALGDLAPGRHRQNLLRLRERYRDGIGLEARGK